MEGIIGPEGAYAPLTIRQVAESSIAWWPTTEDLPLPDNRVATDKERTIIDYTKNNREPVLFARRARGGA